MAPMPSAREREEKDHFRLTREPISASQLARELCVPQAGAVVVFEGVVRNHSSGRETLYLEYEAYQPMAQRRMEEIGGEVRAKFAIERLGIIHRLGRLDIGEVSVVIVVTAPHRAAAFAACQYAIDRLKQTVPIWKKEYFTDGAVWAESEAVRGAEL